MLPGFERHPSPWSCSRSPPCLGSTGNSAYCAAWPGLRSDPSERLAPMYMLTRFALTSFHHTSSSRQASRAGCPATRIPLKSPWRMRRPCNGYTPCHQCKHLYLLVQVASAPISGQRICRGRTTATEPEHATYIACSTVDQSSATSRLLGLPG